MEEPIKVSIVMPVYNAVKYINKAIESILNQSYKNFELIIIDDGAKDGTAEICQKYARECKNVIYIRQLNAGTCAARNRGITMAKGKYIAFSDHDDEYMEDYLKKMVSFADQGQLDIVKCGVMYDECYADGRRTVKKELFPNETMTREEFVKKYHSMPVTYFGVWNTLYRKDILKYNNIKFPENMRHGQEDFFFNTAVIPYIGKIGFIEDCLYKHYRRISQSTSAHYYADRIDAMISYMNLECRTLKPYFDKQEWKVEYALLYVRKITGLVSYCLSTVQVRPQKICMEGIKNFKIAIPYAEKFSFSIMWRLPIKYAIVFLLIRYNCETVLIYLELLKHKFS